MAQLISGTALATKLNQEIKNVITLLASQGHDAPQLAVILVGDNPASLSYVKGKTKACQAVGMRVKVLKLPADISEARLLETIKQENQAPDVDGILVQLPLPAHLNPLIITNAVDPSKDVDGLHPLNLGKLLSNQKTFVPCTPLGVMEIIKSVNYPLTGKNAVVIGRSQLVGLPLAHLLLQANATVTICHSKTQHLAELTKQADVVVAAVGQVALVKRHWIKPGAFVIDVGINKTAEGHLVGDVDFANVQHIAGYLTPVPKGVGPLTIHALLNNTLKAYNLRRLNYGL